MQGPDIGGKRPAPFTLYYTCETYFEDLLSVDVGETVGDVKKQIFNKEKQILAKYGVTESEQLSLARSDQKDSELRDDVLVSELHLQDQLLLVTWNPIKRPKLESPSVPVLPKTPLNCLGARNKPDEDFKCLRRVWDCKKRKKRKPRKRPHRDYVFYVANGLFYSYAFIEDGQIVARDLKQQIFNKQRQHLSRMNVNLPEVLILRKDYLNDSIKDTNVLSASEFAYSTLTVTWQIAGSKEEAPVKSPPIVVPFADAMQNIMRSPQYAAFFSAGEINSCAEAIIKNAKDSRLFVSTESDRKIILFELLQQVLKSECAYRRLPKIRITSEYNINKEKKGDRHMICDLAVVDPEQNIALLLLEAKNTLPHQHSAPEFKQHLSQAKLYLCVGDAAASIAILTNYDSWFIMQVERDTAYYQHSLSDHNELGWLKIGSYREENQAELIKLVSFLRAAIVLAYEHHKCSLTD